VAHVARVPDDRAGCASGLCTWRGLPALPSQGGLRLGLTHWRGFPALPEMSPSRLLVCASLLSRWMQAYPPRRYTARCACSTQELTPAAGSQLVRRLAGARSRRLATGNALLARFGFQPRCGSRSASEPSACVHAALRFTLHSAWHGCAQREPVTPRTTPAVSQAPREWRCRNQLRCSNSPSRCRFAPSLPALCRRQRSPAPSTAGHTSHPISSASLSLCLQMVYQVLLTILQLAAIGLGAYLIMWALNFQKSSVRGVAAAHWCGAGDCSRVWL